MKQPRQINQTKAGVLLSYVNLALGTIIPLFYTPIMLKLMGQSEYGLYSLSSSVTNYLTLLNMGLGTALARYATKYRADGDTESVRQLTGMFISLYSCMAVLVCIGGALLSIFSHNMFSTGLTDPEISKLKLLIIVMSLNVAFSMPTSAFTSILSAYEQFAFTRSLAICETVAVPALNLVILYLGQGSLGIALIALGVQIVARVVDFFYCKKKLGITPSFKNMPTNLLKEIAGYCFFIVLATIVDMLYWSTDKVLIGALLGTTMVAIYNMGGVFTGIMQNMAHAISNVFIPRVMMIASKDSHTPEVISPLMIQVGRLQFYIVSFILSGFTVFGHQFIRIWAGEGYEAAYYIALLTMVPLAIPLIQSIAFSTIMAQNKHRFRSIVYAIIAVANVVSTYLILPYYGIIGAAVCTAVAFALGNGVIMNIYYSKVIKLDIAKFWKNIIRIALVPVVLLIGGLLFTRHVLPPDTIPIFLMEVVGFSVLFWLASWFLSMNPYEKGLLLGLIKKRK